MAKGSIRSPSTASEFLLPNYIYIHLDNGEVLQQEYSQPPMLPSHFRWVVKLTNYIHFDKGGGGEVLQQEYSPSHSMTSSMGRALPFCSVRLSTDCSVLTRVARTWVSTSVNVSTREVARGAGMLLAASSLSCSF